MAEYIERDALMKYPIRIDHYDMEHGKLDFVLGIESVLEYAEYLPAADVVEVPCRCKDCKHWMDFPNCGCTEFVKVCALAEYMIGQNGYCLYGERKGG